MLFLLSYKYYLRYISETVFQATETSIETQEMMRNKVANKSA